MPPEPSARGLAPHGEPCQDFRNLEIVDETKALKP
jgi:hypothetical protein